MAPDIFGVIVAAIAAHIVGWIWYGPLFGKQWQKLIGMHSEGMKGMASSMLGSFVATLVLCYVLAIFMGVLGVTTSTGAIIFAFWLWLGFVATVMSNMIWYEKKPWKLYAINAGHYLIAMIVAALVLAAW